MYQLDRRTVLQDAHVVVPSCMMRRSDAQCVVAINRSAIEEQRLDLKLIT